jgi:hypothetical protein
VCKDLDPREGSAAMILERVDPGSLFCLLHETTRRERRQPLSISSIAIVIVVVIIISPSACASRPTWPTA